jgi:Domain of unknown function DUF29
VARAKALSDDCQSLYERDFRLWLEQQATLLRERRFAELDLANLVEEIEAMARKDKKAIKSDLIFLLTHLLKHQLQPEQRSSSWRGSIVEHRQRMRDDFEESPSLRPYAAEGVCAHMATRARANAETGLPLRSFPRTSPCTLEQTLMPGSCRTDGVRRGP